MKNLKSFLLLAIAAAFLNVSCEETNTGVAVTGVTLNKSEEAVPVGGELTLIPTVMPEDATNKNVKWSSNDENVAKVEDGKVTAIAPGKAIITVTTEDGGKTAICNVTVNAIVNHVEDITVSPTSVSLEPEQTLKLEITITPENADNKTVSWKSSATAVATVDNGVVTAVADGTAVITVTTADGGKQATCTVTVITPKVRVTSVELSAAKMIIMNDGDPKTLTCTVLPEDASNKNVAWSSDNTAVATVENGVVTPVADGTAKIIVTTDDGKKTAECVVTVNWLGEIAFLSVDTWTAGTQIWSAAVVAERCRKDTYSNGYQAGKFVSDCRQNPEEGPHGHWFSQTVVETYPAELCPDGWRVPSAADFTTLIGVREAAGGYTWFRDVWGADMLGGRVKDNGSIGNKDRGAYMTSTVVGATDFSLFEILDTGLGRNIDTNRGWGSSLRCVKDA